MKPDQPPPKLVAQPFRAVIVAAVAVNETWRTRVSAWIVESGCLYVSAWGVDCELWHDSVDWANIESFDYKTIPEDRLVMTSGHDDEPLSEAFWFIEQCAYHPEVELTETFIVHIAPESRSA